MNKLNMFNGREQELGLLEKYIRNLFNGESELEILEAGCGQKWPLELTGINFKLTGIDIDKDALEIRKSTVKDLDEAIVGDLRYFEMGDRKFDVIYNAFVLEHVENAEQVLKNLHSWLKPGGLLILKIPDRDTVFGFMTRMTPFWFHVLYKRYIQGLKNAGKPGFAPYPTYYDKIVSRKGINRFCKEYKLIIREEYGFGGYIQNTNLKTRLIRIFSALVSALTLGVLPWKHNNLTYVLEKE